MNVRLQRTTSSVFRRNFRAFLSTTPLSRAPAFPLDDLLSQDNASSRQPSLPLNTNPHTVLDIPPAEDPLLRYVASVIMRHGKRHSAERSVSRCLLHIHAFTRAPPLPIFRDAIMRAAPFVRVITHKLGGKNIIQPIPLTEKQRISYAMWWILEATKVTSGKTIEERLARELIAITRGESAVLKKKEDMHKAAMINRGNIKDPQK